MVRTIIAQEMKIGEIRVGVPVAFDNELKPEAASMESPVNGFLSKLGLSIDDA